MSGAPFSVSIDESGPVVVLRLGGDVDRNAQEAMGAAYSNSGAGSVVLDFTKVDYINSTGIAVIVGILARGRAEGRSVRACGLTDHYRQIFEITRIADFMAIFDDESSAVAIG